METAGPVGDRTGDTDASGSGVVGADGGVIEGGGGSEGEHDSGCATFPIKAYTGNKQNPQPVVTGTGFRRVKISIPVPVPAPKPALNPRVYPYPCRTLGTLFARLLGNHNGITTDRCQCIGHHRIPQRR